MEAEVITSTANPLLRDIRKAVSRGGLTSDGYCVAETPHLLEEAVRSGRPLGAVLITGDISVDVPHGTRVLRLDEMLFKSVAATEAPQGVIALVRPPAWTANDLFRGVPLIAVLDGIQDPGNTGTILRSAEAFGATGVLLLKGSASAFNPKAVRASAGSVFRMPAVSGLSPEQARDLLSGTALFAAAAEATLTAGAAAFAGPCSVVIGSEGRGVSPEMRAGATLVRIPTLGVESLNAAVAAAVLLYEASRQRSGG